MRWRSLFEHLKPPRGFRLTKAGRIFFAFLFAVIVVAMLTGNNLLFLILAVMMAFMIVSGIESEYNLRHLELERVLPGEVYACRPARLGYALKNPRRVSRRLVVADRQRLKLAELDRGQTTLEYVDEFFARRGEEALGDIIVYTTYPYGLFEKSITFPTAEGLVVFPEPLAMPASAFGAGGGERGGPTRENISHVRGYVPGDSLAAVVWKKQHLGLHTRMLEGGAGGDGIVVLLPGGNMESKLGHACWLIGEFAREKVAFGLSMNDYFSGLATGDEHKREILRGLALVEHLHEPTRRRFDERVRIIEL